jgi:hypothetical protein
LIKCKLRLFGCMALGFIARGLSCPEAVSVKVQGWLRHQWRIAFWCVIGSQQGQQSELCTRLQSTQPFVMVESYVLLFTLPTQTLLDRLPRLCHPRARENYSDMLSGHIQLHW